MVCATRSQKREIAVQLRRDHPIAKLAIPYDRVLYNQRDRIENTFGQT